MAWLAADYRGECIYEKHPHRVLMCDCWLPLSGDDHWVMLPKGTIKKIIGRELTWKDEPVEIE